MNTADKICNFVQAAIFLAALAVSLVIGHSAQAQQESVAQSAQKTTTERLLKTDLDPFLLVGESGWTHLHWAALANDGEAIRRLIKDMGGAVDPVSNSAGAFTNKEEEFARLLGVKELGLESDTPLHIAAKYDKLVAASTLIAIGADTRATDDEGDTPLHDAAWFGALNVMSLLIASDEDLVNATNNDGDTPMHYAAWSNQVKAAKLLTERGASVTLQATGGEWDGWTPMDYANERGNVEMQSFLREIGGDEICNKRCE